MLSCHLRTTAQQESATTTSPGILLMEMREQESMRPGESLRACSIPPQPFPSYAANAKFLLHSRPSLPICPLLTCISQSAQSLHGPFLQNRKFLLLSLPSCLQPRSKCLQLDHIANLDDRLF